MQMMPVFPLKKWYKLQDTFLSFFFYGGCSKYDANLYIENKM